MNFKIVEAEKSKSTIFVTGEKSCLSEAKSLVREKKPGFVELDFFALNLDKKLYGSTKQESVLIQKQNCKKVLKLYALMKRFVKILKKTDFDGTLYVKNLKSKKNNNDYMLMSLLNIGQAKPTQKFKLAYEAACDFLDMENNLNAMCDFKDNRCAKHRAVGTDKNTGCCASFCTLREPGKVCPHKNLSCKIFMCDYLIEQKGFYFTPNTIPVLRRHFTFFERLACFGLLCQTEKKSLIKLRGVRVLEILYVLLVIGIALVLAL